MRKININGENWTTVDEIGYAIHEARKVVAGWEHEDVARKAVDLVSKILFDEELSEAANEDERNYILEIPGTYVVARRVRGVSGIALEYFWDWIDHYDEEKMHPSLTLDYNHSEKFFYESDAQEVADKCGEDFSVIDVGRAAKRRAPRIKKLLDAILGETKKEENPGSENPEKKEGFSLLNIPKEFHIEIIPEPFCEDEDPEDEEDSEEGVDKEE